MKKIISILVILIFITGCSAQNFPSAYPAATPVSPNEGKFKIELLGSAALGWILTDLETGCQYIAQDNDVAYTPRLNSQGVPMCSNTNKK